MRKILSIATAVALTFNSATAQETEKVVELTETHQTIIDAAGSMLLAAAESKLASMADLSPDDFITEGLIRETIRSQLWGTWRGLSYPAREYVFDSYQCSIFSHFSAPGAVCNKLLAAESVTGGASTYYTERSSLPNTLPVISLQMRKIIYSVGRTYLKTPDNLRAVYEKYADAAVDEFDKLFYVDQQEFKGTLEGMLTAIKESRNEALPALFSAQKKASQTLRYISDRESDSYEVATTAATEATETLNKEVSQMPNLEFILRRFTEGGPNLVAAYEEIFKDLLTRVTPD
jgi:hypothetical protein